MSENKYKPDEVVVDVWGDFAMFAPPESSAERVSYSVPTPSAMRNFLNSIYAKPIEFYYQITQIEVIKLGGQIVIMKNEVKSKIDRKKVLDGKDVTIYLNGKGPDGRGERTQRNYVYLKDVYYRIHAKIVLQNSAGEGVNLASIKHQFEKRRDSGKCFSQPFLGTRECMAFFAKPNYELKPIQETRNFGIMLYDVFDPRANVPLDTSAKKLKKDHESSYPGKTDIMFYSCVMTDGIIDVPLIDSEEVKKVV